MNNKFCEYKISKDKWRITIAGKEYGIPAWINKNTLDQEKTMEILLRSLSYTYNIPLKNLIKEPDWELRLKEKK